MLCRFKSKRVAPIILLIVGIISLTYGIVAYQTTPADAHDYNQFLGMLTGFGSGIVCVALFYLIRARVISPEKRKQKEVEQNDERNIAIQRAALTISAVAAIFIFASLAFAFTAMGFRLPSYLCIGAMYLQILIYLIALRVYRKKM